MKWYSLRCPDCNGEVEVEEDRYVVFCRYCGARIVIDNEAIINGRIKLREIEAKERIKRMEYDSANEKERQKTNRKAIKVFGDNAVPLAYLGLMLVLFLMIFGGQGLSALTKKNREDSEEKRIQTIYSEVQDLYFEEDYERALRKAELIYYDSSIDKDRAEEWDKRRRAIISSIEEKMGKEHEMIAMPNKSSYYYHKNYKDVITEFEQLGFFDISTDTTDAFIWKSDLVTEISINGKTDFKENDEFPDNAVIVIRYTD